MRKLLVLLAATAAVSIAACNTHMGSDRDVSSPAATSNTQGAPSR